MLLVRFRSRDLKRILTALSLLKEKSMFYVLALSVSEIQYNPSIAMMDCKLPKNRQTVEYLTDGTCGELYVIILK